jgi:hypothetical protein
MVLAVTDGLGGVDILINAAARPNTGAVAGIDAFDDSDISGVRSWERGSSGRRAELGRRMAGGASQADGAGEG